MARQQHLTDGWHLEGAPLWQEGGAPDVRAPYAAPQGCLEALREAGYCPGNGRSGEWPLVRRWELLRTLTRPFEPAEGQSERGYLHFGMVRGEGRVLVNGEDAGALTTGACVELTPWLLDGACRVALAFAAAPERGFAGLPALEDAPELRMVYFARFCDTSVRAAADGSVTVVAKIEGFCAGRVRLLCRLTHGDELAATHTEEVKLAARVQTVTQVLRVEQPVYWPAAGGEGVYTLHLTMERGNACCDRVSLPLVIRETAAEPRALLALPDGSVPETEELAALRRMGIEAVSLPEPPSATAADALLCAGIAAFVRTALPTPPSRAQLAALARMPCVAGLLVQGAFFADGSVADARLPAYAYLAQSAREHGLALLAADALPVLGGGAVLWGDLAGAYRLYAAVTQLRTREQPVLLPLPTALLLDPHGSATAQGAALKAALDAYGVDIAVLSYAEDAIRFRLTPLLPPLPTAELTRMEARLFDADGALLRDTAFTLCAPVQPYLLEAALSKRVADAPLTLRLSLHRGQSCLWRWEQVLLREDNATLSQSGRIMTIRVENKCYAVNNARGAAFGLLSGGEMTLRTLMPGESCPMPVPEDDTPQTLSVKAYFGE